jgi:hypothetical protein
MKIQLPSSEHFVLRDCIVGGDECVLVFPKAMGVDWDESNKIFRSSIWRKSDMKPVSLSFRKFTNVGEKPEFEPLNLKENLEFIRKVDGSCLIVSKFNGKLVARTRGTSDARILDNGYEIGFLIKKYPFVFDNPVLNSEEFTLLFEWYSNANKIVVKEADEPTLWLTGIVQHSDYQYLSQTTLDLYGKEWNVQRPERYNFDNLEAMEKVVAGWTDYEGIVIYSKNGQTLKKSKAARYLFLHKVLAGLENEENVINLFLELKCPSYNEFYNHFLTTFDFEIAEQLRPIISKVVDGWKQVIKIMDHMRLFADSLKNKTRKEAAEIILNSYGVRGITGRHTFFVY